ncbi:hypothetical protein [Sulfurospirillum arcachonense]|uniref:hypothetical protein n=1 Tax=Sulfurospirillum arcachonense TaxID=57666 RepID=UPI000467FD17|nr:hypothetical protein [Sulfurospirillum arcachonense]
MRDLELKNVMKVDGREFLISTISMHVRHSWFEDDVKKVVYETMVFEVIDDEVQYHQTIFNERYNMPDEAIAEHSAIIKNPKNFFII